MKLMKHITIALVLCAIPAMAFGQTVSCEDCTHELSYYMGEGGFVATAGEDAKMVTYVATCGGITRTGELTPNDDGVVAMLFNMDNNLACHSASVDDDGVTKNRLQVGPVMDGGWYWITDDMNSAVGNLVSQDVLDNEAVKLTGAGEGVSMAMGMGAVFMKETSSGRVGILPNILPEPPMEALRKCGADDNGTVGTSAVAVANADNARFTRRMSKCEMGDGGTITLATTQNTFTGTTTRVLDKGTVVRPSGTGQVVVTVDLWGNGSGHFATADTVHALLGQPAVAMTQLRALTRLTGVTYRATLGTGPTGTALVSGAENGGITMDTSSITNAVTFTIGAATNYCNSEAKPPVNNSATVSVTALMLNADATGAAQVTPAIARARDFTADGNPRQIAGTTSFTVVCGGSAASSSAHQGQELVPENPFPVE